MREPLSWPYDSEATWRAWRDHLDQVPEPPLHIGALKRDAELSVRVQSSIGGRLPLASRCHATNTD